MPVGMDFIDSISFDIAKQKYYNANKVDAKMAEIRAAFAELISENEALKARLDDIDSSRDELAELVIAAQKQASELIEDANRKAADIVARAQLEADSAAVSKNVSSEGKPLGLSQRQLDAIDKLNRQLDDFNVAQATQIFRIKQALVSIALDNDK